MKLFAYVFCLYTAFGQHCPPSGGSGKLIQASEVDKYELGTCDDVNDYSTYLTSFLDGCTFEHSDTATGKGSCNYECLYGVDCHAMTYSTVGGCHICRPSPSPSADQSGNSYPRHEVFVAGWQLTEHINGEWNMCRLTSYEFHYSGYSEIFRIHRVFSEVYIVKLA